MNEKYLDKTWVQNMVKDNNSSSFIVDCFEQFLTNYSYRPDDEKFPKVKTDTIIDEEQSVRWNREEVKRLQDAREEEVKRLNREGAAIIKIYTDGLVKRLAKEYHITIRESEIIWNTAFERGHSSGVHACLSEYEDLADMYDELKSCKKVRDKNP